MPRKLKPEDLAASQEIEKMLKFAWVAKPFEPTEGDNIKSLSSRLQTSRVTGDAGKPSAVFYSAYGAVKKTDNKSSATKNGKALPPKVTPLPSATASRRISDTTFSIPDNKLVCMYSRFVNMINVELGSVTPDQDKYVNNTTVPLLVFYNADGSYSDHFTANEINEKNFCQGVEKLLKNSTRDIRSISINSKNMLDDISDTVRKRYKLNQELSEAQSKLRAKTQNDIKKKAKAPSSSNNSESSEKKIEALAEESKKLEDQIAQLKNKYNTFGIKSVAESTDKSGISGSSE